MWKACAENVPNNINSFVDDIKIHEVEEESNVYKDDAVSVVSMYNDFHGKI